MSQSKDSLRTAPTSADEEDSLLSLWDRSSFCPSCSGSVSSPDCLLSVGRLSPGPIPGIGMLPHPDSNREQASNIVIAYLVRSFFISFMSPDKADMPARKTGAGTKSVTGSQPDPSDRFWPHRGAEAKSPSVRFPHTACSWPGPVSFGSRSIPSAAWLWYHARKTRR